eukprot:TRINITY_DN7581_c0_g2_i10.p2 TRINITY_DN7581_c0_g2~~TRINITY_DN7581_c0_g2_i10.p2  ORF type:complete len:121 (-),score=9.20 TRINITY_DN7581_c0_g2_i10:19-381(-)
MMCFANARLVGRKSKWNWLVEQAVQLHGEGMHRGLRVTTTKLVLLQPSKHQRAIPVERHELPHQLSQCVDFQGRERLDSGISDPGHAAHVLLERPTHKVPEPRDRVHLEAAPTHDFLPPA